MDNPRQLDVELIDAYRARRALDYLVGFSISPVLWRKLPGSKSAGRVQSVALRLICEREAEIEAFQSQEYWSIEAALCLASGDNFTARLTHLDSTKLGKLDIKSEAQATQAVAMLFQLPSLPFNRSRPSACAVIRNRLLPPQPFSKKRRASSAFPQAAQCKSPKSYMKA